MRAATLACAALLAGAAQAGPAPPGGLACASCHAPRAASPEAPPALLGRPAAELAQALRGYRSGSLAGTIMPRLAKGFDEAEIEALAAWLAAQRAP